MFLLAVDRCSPHGPGSKYVDICVSWVSKRSVICMEQRWGYHGCRVRQGVCPLQAPRNVCVSVKGKVACLLFEAQSIACCRWERRDPCPIGC